MSLVKCSSRMRVGLMPLVVPIAEGSIFALGLRAGCFSGFELTISGPSCSVLPCIRYLFAECGLKDKSPCMRYLFAECGLKNDASPFSSPLPLWSARVAIQGFRTD